MIRTYSELVKLDSFIERYRYLKLSGKVGADTFGFDRWLNQMFYKTPEYRKVRREVILRDNGCDLGDPNFEIRGRVIIHHMNPITKEDILRRSELVFNPEYLILCSKETHEAIHKGGLTASDMRLIHTVERRPNDTTPWRK